MKRWQLPEINSWSELHNYIAMSQNLYQEASQRVINNFHYILETMDKITEKELQNEFLMWRSEYGIGNLIKNFLFT